MKKTTIAFLSLCSTVLTTPAFADVSVHVLDTNKGLPAKGVEVQFFEKKMNNGNYQKQRPQTTMGELIILD